MVVESGPKRGRGRPPNPDHEIVIEVALKWVDKGYSVHRAVRFAIDMLDNFGGARIGDAPPVPGPTGLVKGGSKFAKAKPRLKAAMAKWEAGRGGDAPPWPETTLDDRDTAVEQIARKVRQRLKARSEQG